MFLSASWGGGVSDRQANIDPGFFDIISMSDCILVDRGFTFKEELASVGATPEGSTFYKGKNLVVWEGS